MAICKYFLQGKCKFGDRCKFDHPRNDGTSQNRFAALSNSGGSGSNNSGGSSASRGVLPFSLNRDMMFLDLVNERPIWILSAYGPGRDAPAQLFGGYPREQSFEEMRVEHYLAVAMGHPQEAINKAQGLVNDAENQIQVARNDLDGAIRYIINSQNEHPNRIDVCKSSATGPPPASGPPSNLQPNPFKQLGFSAGTSSSNGFGSHPQPSASTAFGQPANLGKQPSPFGQPSQLGKTTSPFGQPSQLGQKASPFGQSSQLGQTSSPFGQPSQLGQRPSPFGQPAPSNPQLGNPFAQNTAMTAATANTFAKATPNSPFGAPSQSTSPNVFGQPSKLTTANAFGQVATQPTTNVFGAANKSNMNPFSPQNALTSSANPFGQPSDQRPGLNAFGSAPAQNPNSAPSPFGSLTQGASNSTPAASNQGFGNSGGNPEPFPFDIPNPNAPDALLSHPDLRSYSVRDAANKLILWKSKPVTYIANEPCFQGDDGKPEKIWFPNGPPIYSAATEPPAGDVSTQDLEAHKYLREHGSFQDGIMPSVPPKREYCRWDF